jgi:hypothetical protein
MLLNTSRIVYARGLRKVKLKKSKGTKEKGMPIALPFALQILVSEGMGDEHARFFAIGAPSKYRQDHHQRAGRRSYPRFANQSGRNGRRLRRRGLDYICRLIGGRQEKREQEIINTEPSSAEPSVDCTVYAAFPKADQSGKHHPKMR